MDYVDCFYSVVQDKEEEYSALDALAEGINEGRPALKTPIMDFDNGAYAPPNAAEEERAQPSNSGPVSSTARASHKRREVRLSDGRAPVPSKVPDHVLHPERYTRYDLEESLVVGGGIGQLQMREEGPSAGDRPGPSEDNLIVERQNEDSVQPMDVGTASTSEMKPSSTHSRILYRPPASSRTSGSERQGKPDPSAIAGGQVLSLEDDAQETLGEQNEVFSVVKTQRKNYRSRRPLDDG